jgi:hypothetical protein
MQLVDYYIVEQKIYSMKNKDVQKLAEKHGLILSDEMSFNEMGIDFRVGFTVDTKGGKWLVRIPRRTDLGVQIATEKQGGVLWDKLFERAAAAPLAYVFFALETGGTGSY